MTTQEPAMRKTRFVCISDTHNASPDGAFKLPKGDILIHAGDMTNQGSYAELQKASRWLEETDFETKIIIAGNHDITLDVDFYSEHGSSFHNQNPQDSAKCQALLTQSASIIWLRHESAVIKLDSPNGPHTTFKVFGSPFSPANGKWAFGYKPEEALQLWDKIPLDSDIVITHTPPKYHLDERKTGGAVGCDILRETLWRVRPRLTVCGHVHEGRGAERVSWDLDATNMKFGETSVHIWKDPGMDNQKLSKIDLTAKSGNPIANDGARGDCGGIVAYLTTAEDPANRNSLVLPAEILPLAKHRQKWESQYPNLATLSGRLSRRETCIVNAAIMSSSWPHGSGEKKFNKPIVVDIDLPVW